MKKFPIFILIFFCWHAFTPISYANEKKPAALIKLRLLETTDLHASLSNFNYFKGKRDNRIGLIKTASLIMQAKAEVKNCLLFDVGDHLQGNPLGGYIAWVKGIPEGKIHPVYRAFNYLRYDAITIGNHEFNFGLDFLKNALKGAKMPVINANVINAANNNPYFQPYVILKRTVKDENGNKQILRIGVIGILPPQIMKWDKIKLEEKIKIIPMLTAVKKYIPVMKENGADIIIVLAHTGISSVPYTPDTENAAYFIAEIPEVDAVLTGHSHSVFPGPTFRLLPHANLENGTIFGKPVVMAGAFGNRLGIIDLNLKKMAGKWTVTSSFSSTRPIADHNGNPLVQTEKSLYNLIKDDHLKTINYMKKLGL